MITIFFFGVWGVALSAYGLSTDLFLTLSLVGFLTTNLLVLNKIVIPNDAHFAARPFRLAYAEVCHCWKYVGWWRRRERGLGNPRCWLSERNLHSQHDLITKIKSSRGIRVGDYTHGYPYFSWTGPGPWRMGPMTLSRCLQV